MMVAPAPALTIAELRVDYGSHLAVEDLTLRVEAGEICGLVGPNGAGKTSTFKVLATLLQPTYGEVRIAGHDIFEDTAAARQCLGYMPDLAPVPTELKVWEFLDLFAAAHGLAEGARAGRIAEVLEEVKLTRERAAWCHQLSRGQTQRLVLAKTLLHRPQVLILDEPASGLDPLSRVQLRETVRELARGGAAIIISSHILSELAEMCTSLAVMARGRLLANGPVEQVRQQFSRGHRQLVLTLLGGLEEARRQLEAEPGGVEIEAVSAPTIVFRYRGSVQEQAALLARLCATGLPVVGLEERTASFEEILRAVAAPAPLAA